MKNFRKKWLRRIAGYSLILPAVLLTNPLWAEDRLFSNPKTTLPANLHENQISLDHQPMPWLFERQDGRAVEGEAGISVSYDFVVSFIPLVKPAIGSVPFLKITFSEEKAGAGKERRSFDNGIHRFQIGGNERDGLRIDYFIPAVPGGSGSFFTTARSGGHGLVAFEFFEPRKGGRFKGKILEAELIEEVSDTAIPALRPRKLSLKSVPFNAILS